jgi:multiple sugar transport system substrate-binding protein
MYWNKDLFTQAGLDPNKPPTNRAEFLKAARALTVDTAGKHPADSGFDGTKLARWGLGVPTPWMGGTIAYAVAVQNGVTFVGDRASSFKANFDSPAGIDAFQFLVDLVQKEHVSPANATEQSEIDAFRAGKVGMNFTGVWMLDQYRGQAGLNFGVAAFPNLGTGAYKDWAGGSFLALPKQKNVDAKRQAAALTFVNWITLAEQDLAWTAAGSLPTQPGVASSSGYATNAMNVLKNALPGAYIIPGFPFIAEFRGAWDAAFEAAILGKKDVVTALKDGVKESDQRVSDALKSLP